MIIPFNKYQETVKNFIITDNCTGVFIPVNSDQMKKLCNRRFEIGADGFILLSCSLLGDFKMKLFSPEGYDGTMCGTRLEEDIIACGKGVTASAIVSASSGHFDTTRVPVKSE